MKLSLAFDACALLAVLVLCGAVATAEQPAASTHCKVHEALKADGSCKELPAEVFHDPEADRVRELHKELAGTRIAPGLQVPPSSADKRWASQDARAVTFKVTPNPAAMMLMDAKRCTGGKANDVFFTVYDSYGQQIVSINECTGAVTVAHPERMNEQARAFWRTVQTAWPAVCSKPAK